MILRTWSGARLDVCGWRALLRFWALGWIRYALRGFRPGRCPERIRLVSRHERKRGALLGARRAPGRSRRRRAHVGEAGAMKNGVRDVLITVGLLAGVLLVGYVIGRADERDHTRPALERAAALLEECARRLVPTVPDTKDQGRVGRLEGLR